jgi:hypothetical protein
MARAEGFDLGVAIPSGFRRPKPTGLCRSNPTTPGMKKTPACHWQTTVLFMARAEGFEPPNASTKNWCLTTWRRPTNQW